MIVYLDPSALVPLLIDEPSSVARGELSDFADRVICTRLGYIEAVAALAMAQTVPVKWGGEWVFEWNSRASTGRHGSSRGGSCGRLRAFVRSAPARKSRVGIVQPLAELSLTRSWHWGIAVLGNPLAEVPTEFDERGVAAGDDVVTLRVRHAQDIEAARFEGDWDWATATIHLRLLGQEEATERHVLCDAIIATALEVVSLGDADGMLVIPAPSARTRVIVSAQQIDPTGLDVVWLDLLAVPS